MTAGDASEFPELLATGSCRPRQQLQLMMMMMIIIIIIQLPFAEKDMRSSERML